MFRRNHSRPPARRRPRRVRYTPYSLYRRALRIEPLEDRRLLAVVTVTTLSDVTDLNDGLTTLREAVFATNLVGGADTIAFASSLTANAPASIVLTQGQLRITDALTIQGPGASLLTLDASGSDLTPGVPDGQGSRLFEIDDGTPTEIVVSINGLRLTGGDFTDHSGNPGAILSREKLQIVNVIVEGNSGDSGVVKSRSLIVENSNVINNSGLPGGSSYILTASTLTIRDSDIRNNKAVAIVHGGVSILDTTISDNIGTAVSIVGNADIRRSKITGNTNYYNPGGILLFGTGRLSLTDSIISDNSNLGGNGGGMYLRVGTSETIIQGCTFSNNLAESGGAIAGVGRIEIRDTDFVENIATHSNSGGGALAIQNIALQSVSLLISDSTFRKNTSSGNGGALFVNIRGATNSVAIVNSLFDSNIAQRKGGGGYVSSFGTTTISGSILKQNAAQRGGGLWTATVGATTVDRTTIDSNTAVFYGGGMYAAGRLNVNATTISGNAAKGAGIFLYKATAEIKNSTISGNSARTSFGGGIYNNESQLLVQSSTITGNRASSSKGGGVASRGTTRTLTTISSSIVAGNIGSDLDVVSFHFANTIQSLGYNLVGNGGAVANFDQPGDQTGVTDPNLGPLADNGGPTMTHALLAGSPAINAGDLSLIAGVNGVPQFDQRGEPYSRVFNGRIDIGAFEYQQPSDLNLVVDTLVDENDGDYGYGDLSLREAVQLANTWSSIDTIRFDPALTANGAATITLDEGELKIADSLTITGPGSNLLTIDASGNDATPELKDGKGSRVFNITGTSVLARINVCVSGLSISGGDVADRGGAISSSFANLKIEASTISGNSAMGGGGGAYAKDGNLSIAGSSISNNEANSSTGTGGGIQFRRSPSPSNVFSLDVTDSEIENNQAAAGGGLWLSSLASNVLIANSRVSGNKATHPSGSGGGIYLIGGRGSSSMLTLTIEVASIDRNTAGANATGGAGVYAVGATTRIADSEISANTGGRSGGGVLLSSGSLAISKSTISGNSTMLTGGGIWASTILGGFSISDSTIAGNSTTSTNTFGQSRGGGAYLILQGSGAATITGTTFRENNSTVAGGAEIRVGAGEMLISDSHFVENQAVGVFSGTAGGLSLTGNGTATVRNSAFEGNVAEVTGNNPDSGRAGGLFLSMRNASIEDSRFASNTASNSGGGLVVFGNATISRSEISRNTAEGPGGGISLEPSTTGTTLILTDSTVSDNTSGVNGGGVAVRNAKLSATNTTFSGNRATHEGGGIWSNSGVTLAHSTLYQNRADQNGGGVFLGSGIGEIRNTVIAQNIASLGRDVTGLLGVTFDLHYSLIGSNQSSGLTPAPVTAPDANGNMIGGSSPIDPRLGPLTNNGGPTATHLPLTESPLINRGDPSAVAGQQEVPQFDQRGTGFPRVQRGRLDIGAVELPPVIIAGDFDANGTVDAADFLLLRKSNGTSADLDAWRANFGASQEPAAPDSATDEGSTTPTATSTRSAVPRRPQFAGAQSSASPNVDESALLGWVAEHSRSRPAARNADWSLPEAKDSSAADDANSAAFDEAFAGLAAG